MLKKINVSIPGRQYNILIENGILKRGEIFIPQAVASTRFAILSTAFLFKKYGKSLWAGMRKKNHRCRPILIPDGEKYKNEKTLFFVLRRMAELGFQRDSCLIALGGGMVGDLGGFAASVYMRGIPFVQCPTTLLAQVDASVGGKTAVDFWGIKNLIGAFHQPRMVLIDPEVLGTLGDRQFKTGLAEVIKYGIIRDEKLFHTIQGELPAVLKRDPRLLLYLISRSCENKAEIVEQDEREGGKRAWLNYGHTLGHALESYFRYRVLTHGEAVAYGMWFAAMLSYRLGICSERTMDIQRELLGRVGLFRRIPRFDSRTVYQKMLLDKKAKNGKNQFILTRKIGLVTIQKNIPPPVILSVLSQFQAEASELS